MQEDNVFITATIPAYVFINLRVHGQKGKNKYGKRNTKGEHCECYNNTKSLDIAHYNCVFCTMLSKKYPAQAASLIFL